MAGDVDGPDATPGLGGADRATALRAGPPDRPVGLLVHLAGHADAAGDAVDVGPAKFEQFAFAAQARQCLLKEFISFASAIIPFFVEVLIQLTEGFFPLRRFP